MSVMTGQQIQFCAFKTMILNYLLGFMAAHKVKTLFKCLNYLPYDSFQQEFEEQGDLALCV